MVGEGIGRRINVGADAVRPAHAMRLSLGCSAGVPTGGFAAESLP